MWSLGSIVGVLSWGGDIIHFFFLFSLISFFHLSPGVEYGEGIRGGEMGRDRTLREEGGHRREGIV